MAIKHRLAVFAANKSDLAGLQHWASEQLQAYQAGNVALARQIRQNIIDRAKQLNLSLDRGYAPTIKQYRQLQLDPTWPLHNERMINYQQTQDRLRQAVRKIKSQAKLDWWDKLSQQEQYDYLKAHPYSRVKLRAVAPGSTRYDIIDPATEENLGNVSRSAQGHAFIDLVMLKKAHKGKGLAKHIYNALEHKLGRPIIPSPLGLSADATRVWTKRLNNMPKAQAHAILDEALTAGRSYGIKDQHILDRLQPLMSDWQPREK